jgi:predicted RND superfamily exporter protein
MKPNVGTVDKIARIVVGLVIISVGVYFRSWLGIIGLIPLGTAIVGVCPAYLPLGLSTCKTEDSK